MLRKVWLREFLRPPTGNFRMRFHELFLWAIHNTRNEVRRLHHRSIHIHSGLTDSHEIGDLQGGKIGLKGDCHCILSFNLQTWSSAHPQEKTATLCWISSETFSDKLRKLWWRIHRCLFSRRIQGNLQIWQDQHYLYNRHTARATSSATVSGT